VTLLLKGSRTIIAEKGNSPVFNSTGNPGMGSGGMGDVLTGVCAALIGSGHSCREAAMLGAWLCGRAAEIAIFNGTDSQESLSATSVIAQLGAACKSLRNGDY
jgi:NAD(P)H-hydrate epimerase